MENTTQREEWLKENNVTEKDVLQNEDGEYIVVESDNGNPEEDGYSVSIDKVFLPSTISYSRNQ